MLCSQSTRISSVPESTLHPSSSKPSTIWVYNVHLFKIIFNSERITWTCVTMVSKLSCNGSDIKYRNMALWTICLSLNYSTPLEENKGSHWPQVNKRAWSCSRKTLYMWAIKFEFHKFSSIMKYYFLFTFSIIWNI